MAWQVAGPAVMMSKFINFMVFLIYLSLQTIPFSADPLAVNIVFGGQFLPAVEVLREF